MFALEVGIGSENNGGELCFSLPNGEQSWMGPKRKAPTNQRGAWLPSGCSPKAHRWDEATKRRAEGQSGDAGDARPKERGVISM